MTATPRTRWGVLYDPAAGTVTVDVNNNHDFSDDTAMKPYKDGYQIGHFGTDNPATDVVESQPFVVQIRKDVPMDPYGGVLGRQEADFVNIGLIASEHGTHVAGITSANGLFGGKMNGAAPGAKIVSSRACVFGPSCTNAPALTEGMIDLVVNHGVDIVNMSIGGLPALNDGNNARSELYTRLIDTYGVQRRSPRELRPRRQHHRRPRPGRQGHLGWRVHLQGHLGRQLRLRRGEEVRDDAVLVARSA